MGTPETDAVVLGRRAAVTAALVFAGCYLGASLGTWLRFPQIGSALLFPPYAIVTAALWRSRPRHWWLILVAASFGTFVPHLRDSASITFVLCAELVNHSRALIAAIGLRRFAGKVQTLREMIAYLVCAVVVAPGVSGVAGALLVAEARGADFGVALQQWWLSNAITAVTFLPLLTLDVRRLGATPRRRVLEIAVVGVAMVSTSAVTLFYLHPSHMYWVVPLLLIAAVRYGWPATGGALLAVTVFASLGALQTKMSAENLFELQVFMLEVAIPLMLVAVLLEQQRKTAAELTASRRQYRSIVEDQTEMICRYRADGTYTFANRAFSDAFGVRDPVGRTVFELVPSRVFDASNGLVQLTLADPQRQFEVDVADEGEPPRWQQWQVRALFDERGALIEYQAVGQDITARKRAEQEHRELEAQRSVEAVLREADRRKDEFVAMLGHELRNPLAPMSIAVEILVTASPASSQAAWARESIGRQLRTMTRLIDDLLDLSRVNLGKIQLKLDAVDIRSVVDSAVEATRSLIESFEHTLIVNVPADRVWLRGDAVRLTQVVVNLLHNAAKYTERGGRIEVTVRREGDSCSLSVRDNGIGLEREALDAIFELFTQLPAGDDRAQGGLGIGLTLVKRLVELHGGTVVARSEGRNRGSEMIVALPVTEVAPQPDAPAAAVVSKTRKGLRILAVDDNVPLAQGLENLLGLWGHTVHIAHDARGALDAAAALDPDVVILDLGLPLINGIDLVQMLKKAERVPALYVSMSGLGSREIRERALEAGFRYHVVKPLDLDWLRAQLDELGPRPDLHQ